MILIVLHDNLVDELIYLLMVFCDGKCFWNKDKKVSVDKDLDLVLVEKWHRWPEARIAFAALQLSEDATQVATALTLIAV